jgi:RNA polymerase sigma factor (sigma-70 family)
VRLVTTHRLSASEGTVLLSQSSSSDDQLLTAGGPDGFALFYRRHVESILRYYARSTRDPEVAADLTAEAFAAALEAKRRFKPGGAPAQAWLFGIASKKLADYHRRGYAEDRARRRLGMERVEPTDADLRHIEGLTGDVEVVSLVEELPADQRRAVKARVVEEREYGEIAGELDITPAGARKRVSRGLAALKARLTEDDR